jgi:hypothetical protein
MTRGRLRVRGRLRIRGSSYVLSPFAGVGGPTCGLLFLREGGRLRDCDRLVSCIDQTWW